MSFFELGMRKMLFQPLVGVVEDVGGELCELKSVVDAGLRRLGLDEAVPLDPLDEFMLL